MGVLEDIMSAGGRWVTPGGGDMTTWENAWNPNMEGAPDVTNAGNPTARLGKDVLTALGRYSSYGGVGSPQYSRQFGQAPGQVDYINMFPAGNGPGEAYYRYDTSGNFLGAEKGAKIMGKLQGALLVAGAAIGGAYAAAGSGAAGGAAGAGAAGATSYTAAGAPVFGIVDSAAAASLGGAGAAGAGAGAGLSYTSGGAPIFGVVDTSIPLGQGISYTASGAPVFGVVDTGAAEAAKAAAAGAGGAGAGGGGGGGGTGAGAGVTKAGGQLGLSKVIDKLGGSLLSAGVSSVVGSLMSPKEDAQPPSATAAPGLNNPNQATTKAVSEMPDPLAQQRSRKRSIVEQLGRRGRASTVLTSPGGRLGG